ncbi:hypothetical protein DVA67_016475 [Solirubrobacter sp. CPCC 204708]|uniref:Protein-arginine deiminase domain-containing protein n=1 Tax=Solirubrobacter deserti TaxID=2282478 RepID=A0ABT4RRR2_9ACTN|nr:protein-arginine deiminase family protein [Solirubrobacter deserti]MBE2317580.1 hypothetical protein [Solirubrobacter deserti]MDA0141274.1 protein-arginine deiminase domain-containing protein [Solirubrobacter deserti]
MTALLVLATTANATAVAKEGQSLFRKAAPVADLQADAPLRFLPNVDDDSGRCAGPLAQLVKTGFAPDEPAKCHDAADTVVNGPEDAADLTPLRVAAWPQAPDDATATVTVAGNARLMRDGAQFAGTLTAAELRAGVELGIEGLDVARAPGTGGAAFTLTVASGGETATNTLTGEVAPVLFPDARQAPQTLYARRAPTEKEVRARIDEAKSVWARIRREMKTKPAEVLKGLPSLKRYRQDPEGLKRFAEQEIEAAGDGERAWQRFARAYKKTLQKAAPVRDFEGAVFAQDAFETGIAATPRGSIRVSVLAPGVQSPRLTGRLAAGAAWPYQELRGRDKGVVAGDYDATGDLEPTPPAPGAPLGKLLVGSDPGDAWSKFLAAQGQQPVVEIDTSALAVGHVDEIVAVIPTTTGKGWVLAVADPGGALKLVPKGERLERGVARGSRTMAPGLDALAARLKTELDADVVRFPVLFGPGDGGLYAATGNPVNGVAVGNRTFLAADPHGPERGGKDVFKAAIAHALKGRGVNLRWVDTLPFPHVRLGETHCYTNAVRDPGALRRWWEAAGA